MFFYWVTQTPTCCFCRQSYACRENMCSSEACNFFFSFLKGTLNTFICYYLVSVGEMHFCFARIHGKNLIICPSNCQQDPSHDYDPCQTIMLLITKKKPTTKKQNAFQTIILLSTTKSFHFLIKFIFCALSQHKKKKNQGNYSLAC